MTPDEIARELHNSGDCDYLTCPYCLEEFLAEEAMDEHKEYKAECEKQEEGDESTEA